MKILVDTNVILDVLLHRPDFVDDSYAALQKAISRGDRIFFSSSAATDVYYTVRKQTGKKDVALNAIKFLAEILTFAEVNGNCILAATISNFSDYEDAVVDAVASNVQADYIITRNLDDFKHANCKAISPSGFLRDIGS